MKKLLQTVAAVLAGLLAVQPAMAALACPAHSGCSMATSQMGPNCPMQRSQAASDCTPECCDHFAPAASPNWPTLAKPKTPAEPATLARTVTAVVPQAGGGRVLADAAEATSLPRYILYRVFRI
jgi:hypothetical protein